MEFNPRLIKFVDYGLSAGLTEETIHRLEDSGFLEAPASSHYHGSYPGGLFDHSVAVADALLDLTKKLDLHWENARSPYLIGLMHDLCKIDQYTKTIQEDGTITYQYRKSLLTGHGEKSVIMLSSFINLTVEEIACIRYHMGAFSDSAEERSAYSNACQKYPNVLWTHTADMMAAIVGGV